MIYVLVVLFGEIIMVLLSKFSFLKQLEDASAKGSFIVEVRYVILSYMNF